MTSEEEVTAMIQRLSTEDASEHNLFRFSSSSELSGGSPPPGRSFSHLHKGSADMTAPQNQPPLNHSMLAAGFAKPAAPQNDATQPNFSRQAVNHKQQHACSSQVNSRGGSPLATLSNTLFITADTEPYHAASMLVAILSQPSHAHGSGAHHAVLHITADASPLASQQPSEFQLEQLMAAARVVLQATILANQELSSHDAAPCDIALVPFMSPAAAGGGSVSVLVITTSQRAAVFHGPGAVQILVSSSSNLQLKSQEITAVVGSGAQADVFYDPADALLLMQTVLLSRWSVQGSGSGQDVLLLPVSVSQMKLVQVSHVLSAKLMQQLAALVKQQEQQEQQEQALYVESMMGRMGPAGARRVTGGEAAQQQGGKPATALAAPTAAAPEQFQSSGSTALPSPSSHAAPPPSLSSQQQPRAGPGPAAAQGPAQQQQQRSHQQRIRKADYVIVTEDTAIKNAAGAIAKVLGRVCELGQCCPVYTERKTGQPTGVISVAVKAITVARGYVDNEGQRHTVAFQPYLRLHNAGGGSMLDVSRTFERRSSDSALGAAAAVLQRSPDNSASSPSDASLDDECSELAFDVFKVAPGLLPDVAEDSNVPVKVTAHSRAHVVSNIITKLVLDHSSAVLITAGGPAMRVAMRAVVAARCRLQANRSASDVLLVPQFVTVDTKNTHGWESVFLKFHIIRVPGSLLCSDPMVPAAVSQPRHAPYAPHFQPLDPLHAQLGRTAALHNGHHGGHHPSGAGGFVGRGPEPVFSRASEPPPSSNRHMHSAAAAAAAAFARQSGPAALGGVDMHALHWIGGGPFVSDASAHGWPGVHIGGQ